MITRENGAAMPKCAHAHTSSGRGRDRKRHRERQHFHFEIYEFSYIRPFHKNANNHINTHQSRCWQKAPAVSSLCPTFIVFTDPWDYYNFDYSG